MVRNVVRVLHARDGRHVEVVRYVPDLRDGQRREVYHEEGLGRLEYTPAREQLALFSGVRVA
jgi:hypothetical protein